jgi:hypothetical protein
MKEYDQAWQWHACSGPKPEGRFGSAALLRSPDQLTFEHLTAPADVVNGLVPALEISSPCVRRRARSVVAWRPDIPDVVCPSV